MSTTEDASWRDARRAEQSLARQGELEQEALELTGDILFERWSNVHTRYKKLEPFEAAYLTIVALDILESSSYARRASITYFKRFIREGL